MKCHDNIMTVALQYNNSNMTISGQYHKSNISIIAFVTQLADQSNDDQGWSGNIYNTIITWNNEAKLNRFGGKKN